MTVMESVEVKGKVYALDIAKWEWEALPDLNIARGWHSSTSLGEAVYVACGKGEDGWLDSVERLCMAVIDGEQPQAWTLIECAAQLSYRCYPVFSQISRDELCILGGGD